MSRTRGADGGGELLGKDGKPLPTTREAALQAAAIMDDGRASIMEPRPELAPVVPQTFEYLCDRTTWHKSANPWDVLMLLDMYLGGLTTQLAPEAFSKLSPDVRRHFRRVMVERDEDA